MEWYFIVLIVLGSLLLIYFALFFVVSIFLCKIMVYPHCRTKEEIYKDFNPKIYDLNKFDNEIEKEEYKIKSSFGYNLHVVHVKAYHPVEFKDGKKRIAVMVHGWTSNYYTMMGYADIYLNRGFDVYLYGHRNHYNSDKAITTMGRLEAVDLETVIQHIKEKEGPNIVIGTHGESMGAATTMMHAGKYHSVDFAVEDCGYAGLRHLLTFQCKYINHLPTFPTMDFFNLIFKIKTGTSYKDVRPVDDVATLDDIPMLFVHGDADRFVPTDSAYLAYDAKPGYKKIKIFKGSAHACSYVDHTEEYVALVDEYLKDINVIEK